MRLGWLQAPHSLDVVTDQLPWNIDGFDGRDHFNQIFSLNGEEITEHWMHALVSSEPPRSMRLDTIKACLR
jgi:hypothetical protein